MYIHTYLHTTYIYTYTHVMSHKSILKITTPKKNKKETHHPPEIQQIFGEFVPQHHGRVAREASLHGSGQSPTSTEIMGPW